MSKARLSVAAALAAIVAVNAAEITVEQAGIAAHRWLQDDAALGCPLGTEVDCVRTCSPQEDAAFHVVKLKGGGFVVMSSDTTREPVVAFSSGGDLVESDSNPLWVLLKSDLALRVGEDVGASGKSGLLKATAGGSSGSDNEAKWDRLLGKSGGLLRASQGVFLISDVRVAPLVQSKWNQGNVGDSPCYNCYTPNNYVCGCVATAGAQIMRYFEWPSATTSVPTFKNNYCKLNGALKAYTTQGGYYDWSLMPLVPNSSITDAERQTIGKLTSDIGICVGMAYASGGSSAGGYMLAEAFTNRFGYANALSAQWGDDENVVDISGTDDMKNALLSNFDAGLPVAIGLSGDGGHEIVGDGYGYSGDTLYLHFNMGWSGSDDAWYAPPNMAGTCNFSVLNGFVCNVFTNSADKGAVICSGRVLDAGGAPIANAAVSIKKGTGSILKSATTNAKGIYAIALTGVPSAQTAYTLTATSGNFSATTTVSLKANVGIKLTTSGKNFGRYSGSPVIGNRCGQDITLADVAGVAGPQLDPASCLFYPSTNVSITCATEGATIRYTTDGTDPTESSPVYSGPIFVDDDTMIKARAWKTGMNPSAVAAAMYTYDSSQGAPKGDFFADPIKISGASGSRVIEDNSAYTVEAGERYHTGYLQYHTIWYKWTAPGSGTMTFTTELQGWTYAAAVAAYTGDGLSSLSRLAFSADTAGAGSAPPIAINVSQGSTYYVVGLVLGDECTGVFSLTWSGELTVMPTETSTTEIPVTYVWLDEYFPGGASAAGDYETLANGDSDGDGLATWAEFLLGTDPTNALSRLEATIRMDGMTPIVESNADTNRLATFGYQPAVKGKQTLDATAEWADMNSSHRFFKVFVEMRGP